MNILFAAIAFLGTTFPGFCKENQTTEIQNISDYRQTFMLPLEESNRGSYKLVVTIPEGFKPIQTLEEFGKVTETTIEYIPQNEDEDQWSEIITVHKFIGHQIPAIAFSNEVLQQLLASTEKGKILAKSSSKRKPMEKAHFVAQYTLKNQLEIIGVSFFSGPYDCAGVQYTVRVKSGQSTDDAVKKIKSFFQTQVGVEAYQAKD